MDPRLVVVVGYPDAELLDIAGVTSSLVLANDFSGAHVASHLDSDLTTTTLAAMAGVSTRHLTRLFVDDVGQTPGRYVRRARTEAAAQLLASSPLPVARVARRCGFGSPETLRQAFVARYGITPSRYRAGHGLRG